MTENKHWPFGEDEHRHRDEEAKRREAQAAEDAAHRLKLRNDRLIVGGRAHGKKPGLS